MALTLVPVYSCGWTSQSKVAEKQSQYAQILERIYSRGTAFRNGEVLNLFPVSVFLCHYPIAQRPNRYNLKKETSAASFVISIYNAETWQR